MTTAEGDRSRSRSDPQRLAEIEIIRTLSSQLGVSLECRRLSLGESASVEVDAYGEKDGVVHLAETYARIGRLHGSQPDKVDSDVLKLLLVQRHLRGAESDRPVRLLIVFADETARTSYLRGWRRAATEAWGIEVRVVDLQPETRAAIEAAQILQRMKNA
jgi:hypothetical protein